MNECPARRRGCYLTTYKKHKGGTFMLLTRSRPPIAKINQPRHMHYTARSTALAMRLTADWRQPTVVKWTVINCSQQIRKKIFYFIKVWPFQKFSLKCIFLSYPSWPHPLCTVLKGKGSHICDWNFGKCLSSQVQRTTLPTMDLSPSSQANKEEGKPSLVCPLEWHYHWDNGQCPRYKSRLLQNTRVTILYSGFRHVYFPKL